MSMLCRFTRLKEIHNKRTLQRAQIIGDRVQQLIREVDGLGWGTDISDKSSLFNANARSDLLPGSTRSPSLFQYNSPNGPIPAKTPAEPLGLIPRVKPRRD